MPIDLRFLLQTMRSRAVQSVNAKSSTTLTLSGRVGNALEGVAVLECGTADSLEVFVADDLFEGGAVVPLVIIAMMLTGC